jgi:hypothetical protein
MEIETLIDKYSQRKQISEDEIQQIRANRELREGLCSYFREHKNRDFAIELLNTLIFLRKDPEKKISIDDLMLASYILGFHQQIKDSLLIWKAKNVDFDSYCGFDIQLIPFAGPIETINYLQSVNTIEATEALQHITACLNGGDFDSLKEYYSLDNLPWWV